MLMLMVLLYSVDGAVDGADVDGADVDGAVDGAVGCCCVCYLLSSYYHSSLYAPSYFCCSW